MVDEVNPYSSHVFFGSRPLNELPLELQDIYSTLKNGWLEDESSFWEGLS